MIGHVQCWQTGCCSGLSGKLVLCLHSKKSFNSVKDFGWTVGLFNVNV